MSDTDPPTASEQTAPRPRYRFSASRRVRSGTDFKKIYDAKRRAGDSHLLIFGLPNDLPHPRIGLSVSKKHGNAPRRNRLKRLLREAFRLSQHELPTGWDFILIPRQNSGASLDDYRDSLVRLTKQVTRKRSGKHRK